MINRKNQKVSEICHHVPELACARYKEIIREVYSCLTKNGVCWRVAEQGCDRSKTEWNQKNGMLEPLGIELCVSNYVGRSVLWDLVHELAHLLFFDFGKKVPEPKPWWLMESPPRCAQKKEEAQLQLNNEEVAWDVAEEWLRAKFTLTEDEWDDFKSHRESRLDTYRNKVKRFQNK